MASDRLMDLLAPGSTVPVLHFPIFSMTGWLPLPLLPLLRVNGGDGGEKRTPE